MEHVGSKTLPRAVWNPGTARFLANLRLRRAGGATVRSQTNYAEQPAALQTQLRRLQLVSRPRDPSAEIGNTLKKAGTTRTSFVDPFGREDEASRVFVLLLKPREQVSHCGELVTQKVTASQELLEAPAPIRTRESRIGLVMDRFNGKSNVGNVGVDHTEFECADDVAVAGIHVSITARTLHF
ncbi:hypothetical protein CR51_16320 [Caballeronia megalochromosomata]|nr:hypothetical protein CR51_16320 [Caballeronia megalochromosomata]